MISTGKKIYSILSGDAGVMALLSSNSQIRPLVLPIDTVLPGVIYQRVFNLTNTKDGYGFGEATVSISVYSQDYGEGVTLAERIRHALVNFRDSEVRSIQLNSGTESFVEDAFLQTMSFSVKGVL